VVERVLEQLAAELNADPARPVLGVVRLNGVVHAEERAAFRNIARQLCLCGRCPRLMVPDMLQGAGGSRFASQ